MILKHASSAVAVLEVVEASSKHATLMKDAHRHTFDYQPRKGFIYIRSRAISSRTNDNYDTFPADELRKSWGSFIGKPVFVNHHNDDHTRMRGVIIDAALHDDTAPDGTDDTWVEVLMEVDAKKFPKLAEALIKRDIERTSMGCDVMESECSYCGNVARQPNEYCAHVQRMKGQRLRRKDPHTGAIQDVLVHEVCRGLHFFENSLLVEDPADPTAYAFGLDVRGVLDEGDDIAMLARTMPKAAAKTASTNRENIIWQSPNGTWNRAFYNYYATGDEFDEDWDHEWDVEYTDDFGWVTRGWPTEDAAENAWNGSNPGGWSSLPFGEQWDDEIARLDAKAAEFVAKRGDSGRLGHWFSRKTSSLEGVGITDTVTVPPQVETLRLQECPVCDAEATWNSDGRCDVCGYLPAPKPFREPDTDIAGRTDHDGGWFDPDLATAKPFTLASSNPVGSPHSASKRQKANPQGAHDMSKQQPSVATAARRRTATARPSESEQRLARENAQLREMVARLRTRADVNNPANPVPEPAPGAPADTDEGARSKPQAQNVDVENAGGVLPDPQDAPASVTTPGDEMVDPILAGTNQTDDVEVPVAGTTSVDPDAVEEVVPDTRAETFGEPAYRGDWINPGANTVPDIGGNAATARKREAALVGRAVNATRDRIWASLRLARLRIETGLAQGDDIEVARQIEASNDMPMNVLHNEIATLTSVAARRPVREASAPQRRQERTATRTPSLAAGVQPVISGLAHRGGEDEALFE